MVKNVLHKTVSVGADIPLLRKSQVEHESVVKP
jgi:hypothetical protein